MGDWIYFEVVARLADKFSGLVESAGVWPLAGTRSVTALHAALWPVDGTRQAVLITDACRWDVAQRLADTLGTDATLQPVLATLPTNTPFGMAALLPLGRHGLDVAAIKVAGPIEIQLRSDTTEIRPALYLDEGHALSAGRAPEPTSAGVLHRPRQCRDPGKGLE